MQPSNVVNAKHFSPEPIVRLRDKDGVILKKNGSIFANVLSSTGHNCTTASTHS